MKKQLLIYICLALFIIIGSQPALAQDANSGKKMSFQGTLFENGAPVTGERNFTFYIDLGEGNTWTETQNNVQIIEGIYAVTLGSVTPMPEDLFYGVQERTLSVSVGNTVLGNTPLFSPFESEDRENFGQGIFNLITQSEADSMALAGNISGRGNNGGFAAGVRGFAATDTTANTGVSGVSFGGNENTRFQTAVRGDSYSNTSEAWSTGVWGIGNGNAGGTTYGLRGEARGTNVAFSAAVRGLNFVAPAENGVRYGGFFNTYQVEGSPVSGESIGVRGNGGGSVNNTGLIGEGFGPGSLNIGVKGLASGAEENWAGWFEGNLAVRGGSNLQIFGPNDRLKVDLNYFENNDAGSLVTYGHREDIMQRTAILGSASDRTGGLLNLYDSLDAAKVQLRATARTGDWPTDKNPHGQLQLNGPQSQNIYLGAKVWEENGAESGIFQLFGKPIENPEVEGEFNNFESIFMSTSDFGDGLQQGSINLNKEGEAQATLNRDNLRSLLDLVEDGGKYQFEVNPQNAGILKFKSSVDSVSVLIDSNGPKAGYMALNDSLGRRAMDLIAYPGNASELNMFAGTPDNGEEDLNAQTAVSAQYVGGLNPFVNLIGRNADGSAIDRAQMGRLGGFNGTGFRITDGDFRWLATMQGNAENGGSITLEGPSSSNFWIGQKNWENSDLPFFAMRGQNTVPEGEGTRIPDGVSLEVSRYDDGSDVGALTLRRIVNDQEETATLDFFQLNSLVNPDAFRVRGENGNEVARLERRGDNFGQAVFFNNDNQLRAEIGSFGDNSGFMQLYGPNGNKNIQMGGSDNNRDLAMLRMSGAGNSTVINLEAVQDASNTEFGTLNISNSNDGGFEIGARSWENDGSGGNLTYTAIKSTIDGDDGNRPWLVSQEFHQDENGNQYGTIGVASTNNVGFIDINPGNSGNIDISGSLNQSSDRRLKKNISTLTSGLSMVNKLRGVRYNWKDETRTENKIGFIAQEVEEVLPELVKTRENGFKGVNYAEMTAVLVEAVKELSAQVEALKTENTELKAEASKVSDMEERLAKIEALILNNAKSVNADQKQ